MRDVCVVILVMLTVTMSGSCDNGRALVLGFDDREAWTVFAQEPWWALVDIRDTLNVFHPLKLSETGNVAGAWRQVTIPAHWRPPFALRFFCADDYFADPQNHKPGQLGTESFFEHRFKQVLIDDVVVWERDVIDENSHGSQSTFELDITPYVTAGEPFKLALRVLDKVSTTERNDRDVWFIGGTWYTGGDGQTEEPPRFHTAVWFADPVVGEQAAVAAVPDGKRPHESVVAQRHRGRWPMPPRGLQMPSPAELALVGPAPIPEPGFPITCGIPVPPGMLTDPKAVRLSTQESGELPVQTKVTGWWPDGSVRWLLLNTIAPSGARADDAFHLHLNEGTGPGPKTPVGIQQRGELLTIGTGAVRLEMGGDPQRLVDGVYLANSDEPVMTNLAARMEILLDGQPTPVVATRHRTEVVDRGPVAACVEVHGSLDTEGEHVGRFTFRLYAYAGLPTVQTQFRIYNDVRPEPYTGRIEDPPLGVGDLALVASVPGGSRGQKTIGVVDGDPLASDAGSVWLLQDTHEHFAATANGTPTAEGQRAQGWIAAGGSAGWVQASMWRFWEQYPKSLAVDGDTFEIGLFATSEAMPLYQPRYGEAKRHDVWLTFSEGPLGADDQQAVGLLADEPPRLFDAEWFCLSGGINVLDPEWFENYPELAEYVAGGYGEATSANWPGHFGIRDFGDAPSGSVGQWLNGYWAMVQGPLNWGLAGGNQRWIERSFETARHIADVDCVHIPPGRADWSDWGGVTCAIGTDHSVHGGNAKWPAFQIGESLILHYWMTGDSDSLDAGLANAEYIIRSKAGLGSSEARSQARPLLTLLRAWQATGDDKYREAARQYLDPEYQTAHVIDWRRGAYIQPTYENWRCISAGLDSMYAQNVYEYYRLTGDLDAAQLVVAIADSVYDESMLPQEEGLGSFLFYVRYSRGAGYYTQMAILFYIAYDLTGDERFLRAGRAALHRYLIGGHYQSVHNFGWLDPEFGGWERELKDVDTKLFDIATETPDPDPANYVP